MPDERFEMLSVITSRPAVCSLPRFAARQADVRTMVQKGSRFICPSRAGSRPRKPPDRREDEVVVRLGRASYPHEHLPFDLPGVSAPHHAAVIALVEVLPEAGRGLPQTSVVCDASCYRRSSYSLCYTGGKASLGGEQAGQVAEIRIAETERRD